MTTAFHAWPYCRFMDIQRTLRRKKFRRTNQGSYFLGDSFSNRDNVRAPIQFRKESRLQHLKRLLFLKNRPIHSHVNSTRVIRPIKQNQLTFASIKINKLLPAQFHSVQLLPLICLITFRMLSSIISIDSNITDNIIRKVINVQQGKCRAKN